MNQRPPRYIEEHSAFENKLVKWLQKMKRFELAFITFFACVQLVNCYTTIAKIIAGNEMYWIELPFKILSSGGSVAVVASALFIRTVVGKWKLKSIKRGMKFFFIILRGDIRKYIFIRYDDLSQNIIYSNFREVIYGLAKDQSEVGDFVQLDSFTISSYLSSKSFIRKFRKSPKDDIDDIWSEFHDTYMMILIFESEDSALYFKMKYL